MDRSIQESKMLLCKLPFAALGILGQLTFNCISGCVFCIAALHSRSRHSCDTTMHNQLERYGHSDLHAVLIFQIYHLGSEQSCTVDSECASGKCEGETGSKTCKFFFVQMFQK